MSEIIRDAVSRARFRFESHGEALHVEGWIEPGGGLPAHYHPQQEERWSVLDGEVAFRLGDEERVVGPADGEQLVARDVVHGLWNRTDTEVHVFCRVTPPLHLQEFLTEAAAAAEQRLFTAKGLPRGLKGLRWAAGFLRRYDDETRMVAPPRPVQRLLMATLGRGAAAGQPPAGGAPSV